jgi:hypothetical protein
MGKDQAYGCYRRLVAWYARDMRRAARQATAGEEAPR